MLVGDPSNRKAAAVPRGLCFRCEANMQQSPFGGAPCTGADTRDFPKGVCGGGWRITVTFPSCWDGKNLDTPDHKAHISYPASGTFESGGACPATHPVKIPQVMYELMIDVSMPLSEILKFRLDLSGLLRETMADFETDPRVQQQGRVARRWQPALLLVHG